MALDPSFQLPRNVLIAAPIREGQFSKVKWSLTTSTGCRDLITPVQQFTHYRIANMPTRAQDQCIHSSYRRFEFIKELKNSIA